jgi:hypothetical protein
VQHVLAQERRHAEAWLRRSTALAHELHGDMLRLAPPTQVKRYQFSSAHADCRPMKPPASMCFPGSFLVQVSVPERMGGYDYFVVQGPCQPHPCYMRRAVLPAQGTGSADSIRKPNRDDVVLDLGQLAAVYGDRIQLQQVSCKVAHGGGPQPVPQPPEAMLQMKLSRCGHQVAFTLDAGTGQESCEAFVRDLRTGTLRHLEHLGAVVSLEWAADGDTLLCTQPNELGRPWRVMGLSLADATRRGSRAGAAWGVFEEADERFFVELGRTKDWRCGEPAGCGGAAAPFLVGHASVVAARTPCYAASPSPCAACSPSTATPSLPQRYTCCRPACAALMAVQRSHAWCSVAEQAWSTLQSTPVASCTF